MGRNLGRAAHRRIPAETGLLGYRRRTGPVLRLRLPGPGCVRWCPALPRCSGHGVLAPGNPADGTAVRARRLPGRTSPPGPTPLNRLFSCSPRTGRATGGERSTPGHLGPGPESRVSAQGATFPGAGASSTTVMRAGEGRQSADSLRAGDGWQRQAQLADGSWGRQERHRQAPRTPLAAATHPLYPEVQLS